MTTLLGQSTNTGRAVRKWPIIVALLVSLFLLGMYGCYHSVRAGQREADSLVAKLHKQMRAQDFADIYSDSSAAYQKAESRADSDALFSGIARKLGTPIGSKQLNMNLWATTNGKIIVATFSTQFSKDAKAQETIRWRRKQGMYRLLSYNINSNALLTR